MNNQELRQIVYGGIKSTTVQEIQMRVWIIYRDWFKAKLAEYIPEYNWYDMN